MSAGAATTWLRPPLPQPPFGLAILGMYNSLINQAVSEAVPRNVRAPGRTALAPPGPGIVQIVLLPSWERQREIARLPSRSKAIPWGN